MTNFTSPANTNTDVWFMSVCFSNESYRYNQPWTDKYRLRR